MLFERVQVQRAEGESERRCALVRVLVTQKSFVHHEVTKRGACPRAHAHAQTQARPLSLSRARPHDLKCVCDVWQTHELWKGIA